MTRAHDIMSALPPSLARLTGRGIAADAPAPGAITTGMEALDLALAGGLARGALHEMIPATSPDSPAASGFALALALRAAGDRPIIIVQQDSLLSEIGCLNGSGLAAFGADPSRITLVQVPDQVAGLRAARDSLRCAVLGAVLVQLRGRSAALDLTATRRLALTAAESGVPLLLVLHGADPLPSAAATRWRIASAPSRPLEADAPGHPIFAATLVRNRAGIPEQTWQMEWACDRSTFTDAAIPGNDAGWRRPPLPGDLAPLASDRTAAA